MEENRKTELGEDLKWYAVYTAPRAEKLVKNRLEEKKIETYLPLITVRKQWSDRKKWVEVPLFNSYLFVKTDLGNYFQILNTSGLIKFICFENKPAPIPTEQIHLVRMLLSSYSDIEVQESIPEPGQKIEVIAGPLLGMKGELISHKGKKLVAVQIEQLGYSVLINMPAAIVKALPEPVLALADF